MSREGREGKTVFLDSFFVDSLDLFFLLINIGIGVEVEATRLRSCLFSFTMSTRKQQKHQRDRSIVFSRFTLLLPTRGKKVRPQGALRGRLSFWSFAFHLSIKRKKHSNDVLLLVFSLFTLSIPLSGVLLMFNDDDS